MTIEISHILFNPSKFKNNPKVEYFAHAEKYIKQQILEYYKGQQIEPLGEETLIFKDMNNVQWRMTIESKAHIISENKIVIAIRLEQLFWLCGDPIDYSLVTKLKADLKKIGSRSLINMKENIKIESDYYHPTKPLGEFEIMLKEDLLEFVERGDFHIGVGVPNKTIICRECKLDKFIVGAGDYHTSIKCSNCGWEFCIHTG